MAAGQEKQQLLPLPSHVLHVLVLIDFPGFLLVVCEMNGRFAVGQGVEWTLPVLEWCGPLSEDVFGQVVEGGVRDYCSCSACSWNSQQQLWQKARVT